MHREYECQWHPGAGDTLQFQHRAYPDRISQSLDLQIGSFQDRSPENATAFRTCAWGKCGVRAALAGVTELSCS